MIFVTLGTNEAAFDRLLEAVDRLPKDEELVIQHGASPVRPAGATLHEFLPFEEIVRLCAEARVVVTHAGVGSVSVALGAGKRPIVMPRLRLYREAVDDHQVPFARRLSEAGLVTVVESADELAVAVAEGTGSAAAVMGTSDLAVELGGYIAAVVA